MDSLARKTECEFKLPRGTCRAFAYVESSFNPHAAREESHYFNVGSKYYKQVQDSSIAFLLRHPEHDIPVNLEKAQRSISHGLFQCMGQLLRSLGYDKEYIDLTIAEQFYYFGLYTSQNKKRWHKTSDWVAAYNAGSPKKKPSGEYKNQGYVNKIRKAARKFGYTFL